MTTAKAATKRADEWKEGDFLKLGDRSYEFINFDPAYPRAKARDHFGAIAFIDVSRQQSPRTKAEQKRAERERRRANGEVRCEVWVPSKDHLWLKGAAKEYGVSVSDIILWSISASKIKNPKMTTVSVNRLDQLPRHIKKKAQYGLSEKSAMKIDRWGPEKRDNP